MDKQESFLDTVTDRNSIITAIDNSIRFPEILDICNQKYHGDINIFIQLINESTDTNEMLHRIRSKEFKADTRMSLLKMFRRCVAPVLDTEMTKKIQKVSSESLIANYGHTFKSISVLRKQFGSMSNDNLAALSALIGEYDTRGQSGYMLTDQFFNWFEDKFTELIWKKYIDVVSEFDS